MSNERIDHLKNGDEFFRLTKDEIKLLFKGAITRLDFICCDCDLEHIFIIEGDGDVISFRAFRNDAATDEHRKKKR